MIIMMLLMIMMKIMMVKGRGISCRGDFLEVQIGNKKTRWGGCPLIPLEFLFLFMIFLWEAPF